MKIGKPTKNLESLTLIQPKSSTIKNKIIFQQVGSGPGGAVVANRLSENPNWRVLLAEAGKEETILLDIPIFVSYSQFTDYNWGYKAEPQEGACLGIDENRCRWPRGKSLGGMHNNHDSFSRTQ